MSKKKQETELNAEGFTVKATLRNAVVSEVFCQLALANIAVPSVDVSGSADCHPGSAHAHINVVVDGKRALQDSRFGF